MRNERAQDTDCESDAVALEDEEEAGKNELRAEPKARKGRAKKKRSQVPVSEETPCKNVKRKLTFGAEIEEYDED